MNKTCFNCKHCYRNEYCSLFDELVEYTLSCFMWNGEVYTLKVEVCKERVFMSLVRIMYLQGIIV